MRVLYILDEDFVNYKKPSMMIGCIKCSGKCYKELRLPRYICQNYKLQESEVIDINDMELCERYLQNEITSAIVFGGLEPFDQFEEVLNFIDILRTVYECGDDIVIYTGYDWNEIDKEVNMLKSYKNIIIKFGRYLPNRPPIYDKVLGVSLISNNQFALKLC